MKEWLKKRLLSFEINSKKFANSIDNAQSNL